MATKAQEKDALSREYRQKSERIHTMNQLLKAYTLFIAERVDPEPLADP